MEHMALDGQAGLLPLALNRPRPRAAPLLAPRCFWRGRRHRLGAAAFDAQHGLHLGAGEGWV